MKKVSFSLFLSLFCGFSSFSQGIEFFHGSLEDALKKAKAEEKLVFMDCFTTWCGPCKRMAAAVFPDPEVGAFFNENFICLKKDMEKEDGPALSDKYVITAYPTLLFLDVEGKVAQKKVGGLSAEALLDAARKVLGKSEQLSDWTKNYEEGKRDPETMLGYVRVLNRSGKSSVKVANEYLKTQKDMGTEPNLKFLFEATTEADSKIFDLFIQNRDKMSLLLKPEVVDLRIEKACNGTVKKAIEFKTPELLKEAKAKMAKNLPARAESWAIGAEMEYFAARKDLDGYLDACKDCQKIFEKKDHKKLIDLSKDLANYFPEEPKALKQAEKWTKMAAENGNLPEYWFQYSKLLARNGKKNEAREACLKAKLLVGDKDPVLTNQLDVFLINLKEEN